MEWLWWALGGVCGGLVVLALAWVVWITVHDSKVTARVLKEGEHTTAWLVQANKSLFESGFMDLPASVLVSPDRHTANDKDFMTGLADQVFALKGENPDDLPDEDDAFVAALMADEAYVEGKKDKLPKRFAGGRTVYLAHIMIFRDHLPGKKLSGRRVPCALVWDDDKLPICSRPLTAKEYRRPAKKDDEDY